MRKYVEVLMKIWRNLKDSFRKLCRKFDCIKEQSYSFCDDVLKMAQNHPQPKVGLEILFSVPTNTKIASKTKTSSKSAPSDTI